MDKEEVGEGGKSTRHSGDRGSGILLMVHWLTEQRQMGKRAQKGHKASLMTDATSRHQTVKTCRAQRTGQATLKGDPENTAALEDWTVVEDALQHWCHYCGPEENWVQVVLRNQ